MTKRFWRLCVLLALLITLTACTVLPQQPATPTDTAESKLRVHVLDVGQGDSTFVELPDGSTLLIDGGEKEYGQIVTEYIKALGYQKVDYVVGSHPHTDHIGGLATVINAFDIGKIYMPKKAATTNTFENLLKTIQKKGLSLQTAKAGVVLMKTEDTAVELLGPVQSDYGDEMNLYSAIVKITYGSQRFLIMGDAETENEKEISGVEAEFIRVGHHGSNTSSSEAFVRKVDAEYAVVSVGEGNSYGLPKDHIIARWQNAGATVYRTDEVGTVIAYCDGHSIKIESKPTEQLAPQTEPQQAQYKWILNTNSKKIHHPDCSSVAAIKSENRAESSDTIAALRKLGYESCGNCDPEE